MQINVASEKSIRWPHKCAVCNQAAQKTITTNCSVVRGAAPLPFALVWFSRVTKITYPVCKKHYLKGWFAAGLSERNLFFLGLGVISVFCLLGIFGFINRALESSFSEQFNGWVLFCFVFPSIYWSLFFWAKSAVPVRIRDAKAGQVSLEFHNETFASEFKAINQELQG